MTTVLVTCVGGDLSAPAIRHLREQVAGVRVVGTDADRCPAGDDVVDRFERLPNGADDRYVPALLDLCRDEQVDVVIPGSDEEALAVADATDAFAELGVRTSTPDPATAHVLRNKEATLALLESRGIDVGVHAVATGADELADVAGRLGHPGVPLVVKPTESRGGRGVWLLTANGLADGSLWGRRDIDGIDLPTFLAALGGTDAPELLVTPNYTGDIYDVDVLSDGDTVHHLVPRRRINRVGIPFKGCVFEHHEGVVALARQIAEALQLTCLYDLDIALDADGQARLLEVNPRTSGSTVASMEAGVPLFGDLVRMLLGTRPEAVPAPDGVEVRPLAEVAVVPA